MFTAACVGITLQDAYNHGLTISPDGRHVAIGTCSPIVRLYRLSDGKLVRTFKDKADPYQSGLFTRPAFSVDGKYMTAASVCAHEGVNPVWLVATGKAVARLSHHDSQMSVCSFTSKGLGVFGTTSLYNHNMDFSHFAAGWRRKPTRDYGSAASSGTYAIATRPDVLIRIPSDRGPVREWSPDPSFRGRWANPKVSWPADMNYAAFSADGKTLVGAGDGWCTIAKNNNVAPRKTKKIPKFTTRSIGVSPTGSRIFLGSREGQIAQFDSRSGEVKKLWQIARVPIYGLAVTSDGNRLLSYDGTHIEIWNLKTYTVIRRIKVPTDP